MSLLDNPAGTLASGRKTVAEAGKAEALGSGGCNWVILTAETDNTGIIVVGDSKVVAALATRQGTPLSAGDTVTLPVASLGVVYLDTTVNGDGVTFTYGAG